MKLTIWNKFLQSLLLSNEESSIKLAFLLCEDKFSIIQWNWLGQKEAAVWGLPDSNNFSLIKHVARTDYKPLFLESLSTPCDDYFENLKQTINY